MPDHRAYILRETLLNTGVNVVMSVLLYLALFGGQAEVALWGLKGVVLDCAPQGFGVGFMSVLIPGLITRGRITKGALEVTTDASPRLPRSLLPRALLLGAMAMVGWPALAALLALLSGGSHIPFTLGFALKALSGAVISIIITPPALRAMLATPLA